MSEENWVQYAGTLRNLPDRRGLEVRLSDGRELLVGDITDEGGLAPHSGNLDLTVVAYRRLVAEDLLS